MYHFRKGERIFHNDLGFGVVDRMWPKQRLVTVRFDDEKEIWIVPAKELTHA